MNPHDLHKVIMLDLSRGDVRLFRHNVGMAWQGTLKRHGGGVVELAHARPIYAGLVKGGSDLLGWRTVEVTHDMAGKKLAVWAAIECKTGSGRLTAEQRNFIEQVRRAGGLAGEARSVEDAVRILEGV